MRTTTPPPEQNPAYVTETVNIICFLGMQNGFLKTGHWEGDMSPIYLLFPVNTPLQRSDRISAIVGNGQYSSPRMARWHFYVSKSVYLDVNFFWAISNPPSPYRLGKIRRVSPPLTF